MTLSDPMAVDITLKNYRCFPDTRPARFTLRKGFTAFVGVNNSGKSSLLKFFYEFRNLFRGLSAVSGVWPEALDGRSASFQFASSIVDAEEVFSNANNRSLEIDLAPDNENDWLDPNEPPLPTRLLLLIQRGAKRCQASLYVASELETRSKAIGFRSPTLLLVEKRVVADLASLVSLFSQLSQTTYIGPFRNAINIGGKQDCFDIRVGQQFVEAWRGYKTGNLKRENEAAYRLTQDTRRIFGFEALEINPSPDNQTLQIFVDGRSYRLSELGSGLAQFIVVLANVAIQRPSYILIDEPELNLHPSLQLDFLTTLASYASEGVLFATHNIGLARACADQIYSVRKIAEGESEVTELEPTPRLSEFLGELSFSGYRELGFDKVLLVEGATDVKTFQQFLRLHKKDHQIVLLPLGGSQLINKTSEAEPNEIKRISENVCAVIDSERTAADSPLSSDRQAFANTCQRASIDCHVLDRRATENYFSDRAVKAVKADKYRALEPYEALKDVPCGWAKAENWRIAREMTLDELEGTDLGEFLVAL
jgi:energy-coupling factor transporter ATP-binding protein EcfA2